MIRAATFRSSFCFVVAWLVLLGGCARLPDTGKTVLKPKTYGELKGYLLSHKSDLDQFRLRGPFDVAEKDNFELRLSATESFNANLFLSAHADKGPLVIILHGYESSKETHTYQAIHLASWGVHSLAVQLPNKGPWIANGRALAKIAAFIHRQPENIDRRIDASKIILVGHSFGAAAVAVALAEGAPAAGGILLDPAVVGNQFPKIFQRINAPVMLLGADEYVSLARNRDYFYRFIPSGISEISIKDAAHEDAQFPADVGIATEELQITFVSALTSAALSLSTAGNFDAAWTSFSEGSGRSRFFNAKKK